VSDPYFSEEIDQLLTPDGKVISLALVKDFGLIGTLSGQGLPPIAYTTEHGPLQHGETIISYKLQPRVMQCVMRFTGRTRQEYWNKRAELLNMLRPNKVQDDNNPRPLTLRKIFPDFTIRDIDVVIAQGPDFASEGDKDWDSFGFEEPLRFIANDPTFYDPNVISIVALPGAIADLSVPIHVPIVFGSGSGSYSWAETYLGTWLAYPFVMMTGPFNAVVLSNLTTGESITFARPLASGQRAVLDMRFGYKTAYDPDLPSDDPDFNLIGYVTGDLGSFHLDPDANAPGGVNNLDIFMSGGDGTGFVLFQYNRRYFGI